MGLKGKIAEIMGLKGKSENNETLIGLKDCAPQARNLGILALNFVNFLKIPKAKTQNFSRLRRAFS